MVARMQAAPCYRLSGRKKYIYKALIYIYNTVVKCFYKVSNLYTCFTHMIFIYSHSMSILTTHITPPFPKVFARRDGQNSGCSTSLVDLGNPRFSCYPKWEQKNESISHLWKRKIIFKGDMVFPWRVLICYVVYL